MWQPANKTTMAVAAICGMICATQAMAQVGTPGFAENGGGSLYGINQQKLAYVDKAGNATVAGKLFTEHLPGTGARAGYVLTHGGVIPNSVNVRVGSRTLRAGVDYFLDPINGTLYFAEPVRRLESVNVSYRYVEGQDASRSSVGAPGLALNFGSTSMNLGFGLSKGAGGLDFNTYGLAMNSKMGSGGSLNGLIYYSTPSENNRNLVGQTRASLAPEAKKNLSEAKSDHLIAQNLTLSGGNATFRATFQDIGQSFNGFQAMKQSNAKNADVMAQIAGMEKERGLQRLGFGAGLKLGKADSLNLDWDRIGGGGDDIVRQSLGYQSKGLSLKFSEQTIGEKFNRFNDLREADKGQWAREKGVKRSNLTLGFNSGKGTLLDFAQSEIGDKSGSITGQTLGFASKNFNFALTNREADAGFARLNDLSDADKTALALDIRRQFNPNAAAAEVTAKDKEQIGLEAGLKRDRMTLTGLFGKKPEQGGFSFNQFSIGDGEGEIERTTLGFSGKNFSFSYLDQTIGEGFSRLGRMSDFEKSQFANERGIHRQSLGFNLALNKASSFTYSQLGLNDRDGGMSRQSFAYQGKGVDFKLNLAETDKGFSRARDLAGMADPEKAQIEAERGFKRMDFSANLTSIPQIKGLTLSTYMYDANNAAESLSKSVYRHNAVWQANKGLKLTWLSDGNGFAKDGSMVNGVAHDLITLDHLMARGMKLNLYRDAVTTTANSTQNPTIVTNFLHFETDRSKAQNFMGETKRIDFGNGKFENTTQLDYNQRLNKGLTLHYNRLTIDRGDDPSSDTNLLSWTWQTTKAINFSGSYATTRTNNDADVVAKSFALSGALTKSINLTGNYTEVNQKGKNVQAISSVSLGNAKPTNMGLLKQVAWSFSYAANNNQKKQVTENVAGKLAAMVGKNQIGLEYGGALSKEGKSAISRAVTVVSDRNEKLPLHFDVMYKARSINSGAVQLVRKYNADLKLGKATNVKYAFATLPEDGGGNMQPTKNEALTLAHTVSKTMTLNVVYTEAENLAQKTDVSRLGGVLQGKLDAMTAVEVGYTVDINDQNGNRTDSHTVKLGYDHQLSADYFITLSTQYTMFQGATPDAIQTNVEFKTRF